MLRTHRSSYLREERHRASWLAAVLALLTAAGCGDSDSPSGSSCTVDAIVVQDLPEELTAFEEVALTADISQSNCTDLTVTWSASDALEIDSDGVVHGEVLGGPFEVTASVEGVEGTAETTIVSPAAVEDDRWALSWMHSQTADEYSINFAGYTYGYSSESSIIGRRTGPGAYSVTFTGMTAEEGQRETVAVSAYGGNPARCRVLSWGNQGADLEVFVRCHDLSGSPVDSQFNILVVPAGSVDGRSAFTVTPAPSGGAVPAAFSHNSEEGAIHLEHVGTGEYEVTFAGLSRDAVPLAGKEIFHVTSYGDSNAWCKIADWGPVDTDDLQLSVRCLTPTGADADAQFTVLMLEEGRTGTHRLGYVWADEPDPAVQYTPALAYNFNSSGASNTVASGTDGVYSTSWPGLARPADSVAETNLITAIGDDATYCQVGGWGSTATTFRCFAPTGAPQNSEFTAIWIE